MKNTKLQDLKQANEILRIRPVNAVVVSRYAQAMRQGAEFPPITITPDNIVVKGNHRLLAYRREFPDDHEIPVVVKKYKTEADMIEDSIRDNVQHGYPLDGISRKRAVFALAELGRTDKQIAELLGVSVRRVVQMGGEGVLVIGEDGKKTQEPVKNGLKNLSEQNTEVTQEHYNDHIKRDRCMYVRSDAVQMAKWLRRGWVDLEDAANVEALTDLYHAIDETVINPES